MKKNRQLNYKIKKEKVVKKTSKNIHKSNSKSKITKFGIRVRYYQYKLLLLVHKKYYPEQMSRQLKIPSSTIGSRIKVLADNGFIVLDFKSNSNFYKLTSKGYRAIKDFNNELSRYPRQGARRLHRLSLNFPILQDNENVHFDKVNKKFNNWNPEYTKISFPIGMTFKRTPKTICVIFHEFEITKGKMSGTEFFGHVLRGCFLAQYHMRDKYKIEIGIPEKITDQHIVNEEPEQSDKIDKNVTVTKKLNRKAQGYIETDMEGKAWIDHSKGMPEIETNDFLYEENLLAVPERVQRIENAVDSLTPAVSMLAEQIKTHMVVMNDMKNTLRSMKNFFDKNGQ